MTAMRKLKVRLWQAQNGLCYICGSKFPPGWLSRDFVEINGLYPSLDHVVPRALGGSTDWTNTLLAHTKCNSLKGSRKPFACELMFLEFVVKMFPPKPPYPRLK